MNYDVKIPLKTTNIYDIDGRVQEVQAILEWLEAQVQWQPHQFEVKYLASIPALKVWFKDERHATMCKLRWLS